MNRLLLVFALVLVGGALAWGVATVGGPGQARAEQRDETRYRELRGLAEYHRCQPELDPPAPVTPRRRGCEPPGVPKPDSTDDPLTGVPYRVETLDPDAFQVCGTFERPQSRRPWYDRSGFSFDGQEGCLVYRRSGPGEPFVFAS